MDLPTVSTHPNPRQSSRSQAVNGKALITPVLHNLPLRWALTEHTPVEKACKTLRRQASGLGEQR